MNEANSATEPETSHRTYRSGRATRGWRKTGIDRDAAGRQGSPHRPPDIKPSSVATASSTGHPGGERPRERPDRLAHGGELARRARQGSQSPQSRGDPANVPLRRRQGGARDAPRACAASICLNASIRATKVRPGRRRSSIPSGTGLVTVGRQGPGHELGEFEGPKHPMDQVALHVAALVSRGHRTVRATTPPARVSASVIAPPERLDEGFEQFGRRVSDSPVRVRVRAGRGWSRWSARAERVRPRGARRVGHAGASGAAARREVEVEQQVEGRRGLPSA